MEKVFITGANGFIGSSLCKYLLDKGYDVFGLVRPGSDRHFLEGLPVKLVTGDLRRPDQIDIPADLDFVIHSASVVSDQAGPKQCEAQIYQLTVNLIERLGRLHCRPKRIIYISTALTLGFGDLDISEAKPGRSAMFLAYTRAKKKTEEYLTARFREEALPVVILRPADVFGPQDRTSCARILRGFEKGVPMIVGHGDWFFGFCYIENLCLAAHLILLTPGIEGRTYTITNGQMITWRDFFTEIYKGLNKKQRVFVPVWLAMTAAALQQAVHKVIPRYKPELSYYRIKRVTSHTTYDITPAVRDLGYRPDQDAGRQIQSIVEWYLEEKRNGHIR
ncbi:MAG: NAD-dependent epimerase/dehydratase family protein [Candidatus Aminicenantales bacterium]